MCCFTHESVTAETKAPSDNWRCRCGWGEFINGEEIIGICQRKATAEDILCDVCSGRVEWEGESIPDLVLPKVNWEEYWKNYLAIPDDEFTLNCVPIAPQLSQDIQIPIPPI